MSTCKIFVHSVASVPKPKEVPHEWEFSKYSAELHLQRGLVAPDPRLTSSAETTDCSSFELDGGPGGSDVA